MKPRSRRWASHCSLRNSAAPEARCCFPRPKYLISGGSRIAAPMPSPFWHPAFINCNYQPGQRSLQEPCQEHNFRAIELIVLTLSICFFRVVVPPFVPSLRSSITHSFPCSACHQLQIADPCNARNVRKRWAFPERVTTKYIRGPGLWVWVKRLEFRGSGCCVSGLPIPSTAIQLVAILKDPKEKLARVEPKGSTWRL